MSALQKLLTLVRDPVLARYVLQSKLSAASLHRRQVRHARRVGLRGPVFVLSFDCDTDRDIEVGFEVHQRLVERGITPVYAVPGELLERGADVYRRIADSGAQFINHGYAEHTRIDPASGRYESFFFYDKLSRDAVARDILSGDAAIRRVLGRVPSGFRTPHFGSFQSEPELRFLHGILARLGYRFATTTVPLWGLRCGPVFERFGVTELPVSGCHDWPLRILDTWSFRCSDDSHAGAAEYLQQLERLHALMSRDSAPFLLNIYGDPSQVHDWPEFFEAVGRFAPFAVASYDALLGGIET